jgi:hypothetical protein
MGKNITYDITLKRLIHGYTVKFWSVEVGTLEWAFTKAEDALDKIRSLMVDYGNN